MEAVLMDEGVEASAPRRATATDAAEEEHELALDGLLVAVEVVGLTVKVPRLHAGARDVDGARRRRTRRSAGGARRAGGAGGARGARRSRRARLSLPRLPRRPAARGARRAGSADD